MSKELIEFTDEQQQYIDNLLKERTSGLYTKEDLQREITREVDRRVESGIQKGLETHKAKWEEEFKEKSKLSAEELAQRQLEEKLGDIEQRELELSFRANTLNAKSMLADAEIPREHYEKFVEILVDEDEEKTNKNVENFINTFNETRTNIEKELQKKYAKVPSPKAGGSSGGVMTREEFDKLSYKDKIKLKEDDPELFNTFIG